MREEVLTSSFDSARTAGANAKSDARRARDERRVRVYDTILIE